MAKIRGIKPDLWTDDDFVEVSPLARLLWIGLWNYACDNGHLQDKSRQIKMRILPTDDANCADLLAELEAQGLIDRADGWITIPNLTHHQKPDRRYFTACDKEGCEAPPEAIAHRESRRVHAGRTSSARRVPNNARADGDGDGDGDVKVTDPPSPSGDDRFDDFWTRYPRTEAKAAARKAWKTATKKIDAETLVNLTRSYAVRVHGSEKKFIPHASTWLNQERWEDEVAAQEAERQADDNPWGAPNVPPAAPPEIADDPERYAQWLDDWRRERNG